VAKEKGERIVVGFAMETEALLNEAARKLKEKHLDLICANDLPEPGAGFAVDTNRLSLIDADGKIEHLPLMSKEEAAFHILNRIKEMIDARRKRRERRN